MSDGGIDLTLRIWRQETVGSEGRVETYEMKGVSPDMSFLEMLDVLNERLVRNGERPIAFEHDCREGICGSCGFMIDGYAQGPERGTTVCQLHMRKFRSGQTVYVEPFRVGPFPVLQDLIVDRTAYDRIQEAGGFISVHTGSAPDGNAMPIGREAASEAFDAAACISCGACAAACKNASPMLFVGAKVSHLGLLPQGQPERDRRVLAMVGKMDQLGFGACTNELECVAACPKEIPFSTIARMNRDYVRALMRGGEETEGLGG